jgi:hypothetical protein
MGIPVVKAFLKVAIALAFEHGFDLFLVGTGPSQPGHAIKTLGPRER